MVPSQDFKDPGSVSVDVAQVESLLPVFRDLDREPTLSWRTLPRRSSPVFRTDLPPTFEEERAGRVVDTPPRRRES